MLDIWDYLGNTNKNIIIYGMGNGADKIIHELERLHITFHGITASDDFVRGQTFHGFTVKKISEFDKNNSVILTAFGSQRDDVIKHILSLSKEYTILSPDVPVYGNNIFNTQFYENHKNELQKLHDILADDFSKKVLENEIKFKLTGKINYLTEIFTDKDEIFKILDLSENESYLDLGAYRGDTIQEFLHYTNGHYRHITALEPDNKTYKKLKDYAGNFPNTQLWNMGIWDCDGYVNFENATGRGSSVKTSGSQRLAVTKIDTLFKRHSVSYIKTDVEGAEMQALKGGIETLMRDKPKLNLALYHRSEDIFTLPLLVHEITPHYQLYLRQHPHIPAWDLNLYGIHNS